MKINFSKICLDLVGDLRGRGKEVIVRRFGLDGSNKETLDAIGKTHGITRERVRQIQEDALFSVREKAQKHQDVFDHFKNRIHFWGNIKKEDFLLEDLGGEKFQNHALFLMSLNDSFFRVNENNEYHSFWTISPKEVILPKQIIKSFASFLSRVKTPVKLEETSAMDLIGKYSDKSKINCLSYQACRSFLEISKKVKQNQDGFFGFANWPEISPRGLRDKSLIIFKKEEKPLHFTEIARLIGNDANAQSVHNELIKDPKFVLVGRGIYALKEWGYKEGVVQDVMKAILKEAKTPLSKEEIIQATLQQRQVKDKTVLLNLSNKKYFQKTAEGKYILVRSA